MSWGATPEQGQIIDAKGIRTNYHDRGNGPPLLLLHGSGPGVTSWANWGAVLPGLARSFRAVAPDLVGFGFTEPPSNTHYDLDTWVGHALGVLDALGIEHANICGNSFGGGVALALAIRHPERVNRLILMGSVGLRFSLTPGLDAVWGYRPSREAMRRLIEMFAFDSGLVTEELIRARYEASLRPEARMIYERLFPAPRQRWIDALASPEDAVRRLERETLVLHGREDQVIPAEVGWRLAHLIPKAQLHLFGRCGHWVQIEHSRRFISVVRDFLREERQRADVIAAAN